MGWFVELEEASELDGAFKVTMVMTQKGKQKEETLTK